MITTNSTMSSHIFFIPKPPLFLQPKFLVIIKTLLISFSLVFSSSNLHSLPASSSLPHNVDLTSQILSNHNNNEQEFSHFRTVNRRRLRGCLFRKDPQLQITLDVRPPLHDEQYINVTVSGISEPSDEYWVAMISPSHSSVETCPLNKVLYQQTGDLSDLPLLCHYPVKAAYLSNDGDFLSCKNSECKKKGLDGECLAQTCTATITFHVINIRTAIEFVLFDNGFKLPCILKRTRPLRFANPNQPLYGHISSVSSSSTTMRVTWVSGSFRPQYVKYGNGKSATSVVSTFTQDDMCAGVGISPAKDFGWHDPGYIHSALISGLQHSTQFSYKFGSDEVGWSKEVQFRTPPAGGSDELYFLAIGDMGSAPRDSTVQHYIQPGSLSVVAAMEEEVASGKVDIIFHIGDLSYATGFIVEWDYFLHLITPVASRVSYMTAIGNHERDYINSGSLYITPDSGGECGVPYENYFQMPNSLKDKPWYSIEQGPVHFIVMSTEHSWRPNSEQHQWMISDMALVDRKRTPWLIFVGHRPMYTTSKSLMGVDPLFVRWVEPLLIQNKVELALFGHVHNYERTCAMYRGKCIAKPVKDENGVDTYDYANYTAPVHAVIGMAGYSLDDFFDRKPKWSFERISKYGYTRIHVTRKHLSFEFVNSITKKVEDSFRIIKS